MHASEEIKGKMELKPMTEDARAALTQAGEYNF